jgi:hypothetical protein
MVMILEKRPSLSEGDLPKDGLNRRSARPKWQKGSKHQCHPRPRQRQIEKRPFSDGH